MADVAALKDAGNALFKAEAYLKAAATYTKAIKAAPKESAEEKHALAVLYSNRAASLLKLKKCTKALADAEECIVLRPDWDKGYFRKAAALEEQQKFPEALEAYTKTAELNPGNREVAIKVRNLSRLKNKGGKPVMRKPTVGGSADGKVPASEVPVPGDAPVISNQQDLDAAKSQLAGGEEIAYDEGRVSHFLEDMIKNLGSAGLKGFGKPVTYFLPGRKAADGGANVGAVNGGVAFDSPETNAEYVGFLRQYAEEMSMHAAAIVAPKSSIAYPQVWKKGGWPVGRNDDGWFLQLQSRSLSSMWWVPMRKGKVDGAPVKLPDTFNIVPPVFRTP